MNNLIMCSAVALNIFSQPAGNTAGSAKSRPTLKST